MPQAAPSPGPLLIARNAGQRTLLQLPAVPFAIASACGILAATFLPINMIAWSAAAMGAATLTVFLRNRSTAKFALLGFAVCSMGAWTYASNLPTSDIDVSRWSPAQFEPVVLRGTIVSTIEQRPDTLSQFRSGDNQPQVQSIFELQVSSVRDGRNWTEASGKLRAVVKGDASSFLIGDQVKVFGQIAEIGPPTNPGESDLRDVFAARGIGGRLLIDSNSQLILESSGRWGLMRMLSWISTRGDRVLQDYVGPKHATLASAIVLGRRMAVPPRTRDLLVETGTVHLLSVSGLHLAMVAGIVKALLLLTNLSRTTQTVLILLVCVFFAGLTGAKPPVIRASLLVAAVLLASWSARIPNTINSLAIAAIILLMLNPKNLLETGTQLSFVAVTTLVLTGRNIADIAKQDIALQRVVEQSQSVATKTFKRIFQALLTSLKVSFWVWIVTAPLVWHAYHIIAPISILANLIIVPALAVALTFGMLTAAIGLVFGSLALPFGIACKVSIVGILAATTAFSELPFAYAWLPSPPGWQVVLFYLGVATPALVASRKPLSGKSVRRFCIAWIVCWFVVAIPSALKKFQPPSPNLSVTFIDVGHGTSVLIELPDGSGNWLYDAGRLGDPTWSISPIESVLWYRGIRSLDGVLISHADADHYNAIPDLLHRFNVRQLITTHKLITDPQVGLDSVRSAVQRYGPTVAEVSQFDQLTDRRGNRWSLVLHPTERRIEGSDNANSLVLLLEYFGVSILLPGDLEVPGTENLLQHSRPRPGGVMMSPHHGSLQQDVRPILDWHRPSIVVVSGGYRAARPEVKLAQSQNGADCLVTAEHGAVRITIDPSGTVAADHWEENQWRSFSSK